LERLKTFKLALDWTPNINHIGFFVAQKKEFYQKEGVDLEIISPLADNYEHSPAKKLELGLADIALCPTESIISFRTKESPFNLMAIATLYQRDISAIAVREDSPVNRPMDLDSRTYASYGARYEDLIVKELIKKDGGEGDLDIRYPERLGVWNALINQNFDATWIFLNWEGIQRPNFKFFKLEDYGIPYSYSPLIAVPHLLIDRDRDELRSFLSATKKGFLYAVKHPEESTNILKPYVPPEENNIDLIDSLEFSKDYFGDDETFGKINPKIFDDFCNWIKNKEIENYDLNSSQLYIDLEI
jgi:ABC-type nitrate/sulfonate/bicarbonate transport system substrate-binding protein|tara:strand:- start:1579 stop:2481 length:903 start_codon:yes stop_codon:yes gene_type:complete